jgi:hypothetical protein
MQLDDAAVDRILTIVQLLAKAADDRRLAVLQADVLNKNVEALIMYDSDEFVRRFLVMVKSGTRVLTPNVSGKLTKYP